MSDDMPDFSNVKGGSSSTATKVYVGFVYDKNAGAVNPCRANATGPWNSAP